MKPLLISGIQPTGKLHIGNYLGMLKNAVELQNSGKYHCFYFIADYHSLTEDFSPKEKTGQILDLALDFLAAGMDPKKSTIFIQSAISSHAELALILNALTPMGELERMTQFKDKVRRQKENVNAGLFTYPTLMAADILIYKAEFVPVGEDQLQHLELTRTLARRFNNRFGKTFPEPQALLTQVPRLMSLSDPHKKMSKSEPNGCLFLDNPPKSIETKIKRAVTDSGKEIVFDPIHKPAISNLLLIYSAMSDEPVETLKEKFRNKGYAEFKKALAILLIERLSIFQKRKKSFAKTISDVKEILEVGSHKAAVHANKTLAEVKKKLGLFY